MDPNVIILAVALLVVAVALMAVAWALVRRSRTEEQKPGRPDGAKPPAEAVVETDEESDEPEEPEVEIEEKPRVLKVVDLPARGDEGPLVEILVDWDPNRPPSAFRGKTLDEATKNAMDAIRIKRAARAQLDDY